MWSWVYGSWKGLVTSKLGWHVLVAKCHTTLFNMTRVTLLVLFLCFCCNRPLNVKLNLYIMLTKYFSLLQSYCVKENWANGAKKATLKISNISLIYRKLGNKEKIGEFGHNKCLRVFKVSKPGVASQSIATSRSLRLSQKIWRSIEKLVYRKYMKTFCYVATHFLWLLSKKVKGAGLYFCHSPCNSTFEHKVGCNGRVALSVSHQFCGQTVKQKNKSVLFK